MFNQHKYCVPLSKPKEKHERMRDKIDFKKIVHKGILLGVLNFNLMIPVEEAQIQRIDTKIHKHDNADTRKKKVTIQRQFTMRTQMREKRCDWNDTEYWQQDRYTCLLQRLVL